MWMLVVAWIGVGQGHNNISAEWVPGGEADCRDELKVNLAAMEKKMPGLALFADCHLVYPRYDNGKIINIPGRN